MSGKWSDWGHGPDAGTRTVVDERGHWIADVEERHAAKVIAAPDLYEACKAALAASGWTTGDTCEPWQGQVIAALDKAEGRKP